MCATEGLETEAELADHWGTTVATLKDACGQNILGDNYCVGNARVSPTRQAA